MTGVMGFCPFDTAHRRASVIVDSQEQPTTSITSGLDSS